MNRKHGLQDYSVIYNDKLGMGYILPDTVDINCFIEQKPVEIGDQTIQPNSETTLLGYFDIKPAKYIGMLGNEMIFHLGGTEDLFENKQYYLSLIKVTDIRIFSMFSHKAGRDFNLVNNKWK